MNKPRKASTQRLLDKGDALIRELLPQMKKDIAEMEEMIEHQRIISKLLEKKT